MAKLTLGNPTARAYARTEFCSKRIRNLNSSSNMQLRLPILRPAFSRNHVSFIRANSHIPWMVVISAVSDVFSSCVSPEAIDAAIDKKQNAYYDVIGETV